MISFVHLPGVGEPLVEGVGRLRELLPQNVVLFLTLLLARQLIVSLLQHRKQRVRNQGHTSGAIELS